MELSHQFAEQLTLLEQQAAQCAALLDGAPPEVLEAVGRAFAPLPAMKGFNQSTRDRWLGRGSIGSLRLATVGRRDLRVLLLASWRI